ncbi:MAG: hypothetical protein KJP25_09900 [Gammaproteobacteria bacterium]|nr:hypothetical protein [Gammaproteobacteria bacterium]MBT8151004.1 hypothetical protein [Gammaproteobacteria bacterium]NND38682.1 hypothetical protein [Pseudomonadales bacterium]NNL11900.1 hypothetical protein [Pseudomonadales bacterium]NNM11014.1 hypothetical protein [Pseudomonadales bacterium]
MPTSANDIELAISNDMIDLRFRAEYERDFSGTFAFLHADFKDIESDQVSYGFETRGQIENVIVKLGSRLFFIDAGRADGFGAALGVGAEAFIVEKVSATGQFYYSPQIITGGDLESTLDAEVRVNYQLIENGALFIGYRVYEIDAEKGGSVDIYDDPYLGIKFTF